MRRIAIGITSLALMAQLIGCAADAPTAPKPGGGGNNDGKLQIALFTSDPNPAAGACSLIQATATLNGANVPNGTGIAFTTDLGTFAQSSQPTVSVVTTGGSATTSVCSSRSGLSTVRASATVSGKSGSATLPISFQPSASAAFISFCSPTFGSPDGGTTLVINGGRFFGSPGTTKVTFTAAGVTREGLVTAVSQTQITLTTPGFPEASSLAVPVQIQVTLGSGTSSPTTLAVPNCFVFGTTPIGTPSVTAILPSEGKNNGNTRVTIVGAGFVSPLQVFFGPAEATVLSVSYNQIVALSPPATGIGLPNQNQAVDVRVHEVNSGQDGTLAAGFTYGPALRIISFEGANVQPAGGPFTPVTIHGEGFDAPVKVGLAGIVASVVSVSATELVVVPGFTLDCAAASGDMSVTNINTGETATGQTFTYIASGPTITGVSPASFDVPSGGINVVITGTNLQNTVVTFGGATASVVSGSPSGDSLTVHIPPTGAGAPTCGSATTGTDLPAGPPVSVTVTGQFSGCSATLAGAFQYLLPCVP